MHNCGLIHNDLKP
jgi:serine/threonine protein kinase